MQRGTRIAIAVVTAVMVVALGAGAAALGLVSISSGSGAEPKQPVAEVERAPLEQSPTPTPTPDPKPAPTHEPAPLLVRGDHGVKVRALQHRLFQLAWYTPPMSGAFDQETVSAVKGFQRKRGFDATGEVDARTWRRLVRMTRQPTGDEMFNRSGPALFAPGDSGPEVREVQARLRQIAWFFGDVSSSYGEQTTAAVRGFQAKRQIPATGEIDQRTLDLLEGMTREPTADELANRAPDPAEGAPLDPRCTTGRALCIDKSTNSLRWVDDGKVLMTLDVRFGREGMETREGQFSITYKSRDHVSSIYHTSMPLAMFFSGGQAVHYSPDFAANGYNGASHGCVNVRDYNAQLSLFGQVNVGDKVVVYWS